MSPVRISLLSVLVAISLVAALGCGDGSDDLLNQYGAEGAALTEIEVTLADYAIEGGLPGEADNGPVFRIGTHTDLTILLHNTGEVPHGLSLYADEARTQLLVASAEIPPGKRGEVRFHFHDPQIIYLQDDRYPEQMRARLLVEAHESDRSAVPVTVTYEGREDSLFQTNEYSPAPEAPPLVLDRSDGSAYDLAHQDGRIVVLMFGYVNCVDICPLTVASYAAALRQLEPEQREQVDFVMVTVDPERESARDVQGYLDQFGDDLIGLGGTPAEVESVLDAWRVRREITSVSEATISTGIAVGHTSYTVIVDQQGDVRLKVPAHTGTDVLAADLRLLLREG